LNPGALLVGLLAALVLESLGLASGWILAVATLTGWGLQRRRAFRPGLRQAGLALIGMSAWLATRHLVWPTPGDWPRGVVEVVGQVTAGPGPWERHLTRVRLEHAGRPLRIGKLLLASSRPLPGQGSRVRLTGTLERLPPPRDEADHDRRPGWQRAGITLRFRVAHVTVLARAHAGPGRWAEGLARGCRRAIAAAMPGAGGEFLASLLLGTAGTRLDTGTVEAFRVLGLSHVLAVSGMQVTLITGCLQALARLLRLPRGPAAWAIGLVLGLYALMTGASPAVIRATVMGEAQLLAWALERHHGRGFALTWTLIGMLVFEPAWVHDLGFQFSALATWSLCHWAPRAIEGLRWAPGGPAAFLITSLAPVSAVFPLQVFLSGTWSPLGPLIGIPVALVVEVLTLLTASWLVGAMVWQATGSGATFLPWLAAPLEAAAHVLLEGVTRIQEWPGASVPFHVPPFWLTCLETLTLALVWRSVAARRPMAALGGLMTILACGLPWPDFHRHPRLHSLDGQRGPALAIVLPGHRAWVVDGTRDSRAGTRMVRLLRRLDVREIVAVVRLGGEGGGLASVLEAFPVGRAFEGGWTSRCPSHARWLALALLREVPVERDPRLLPALPGGEARLVTTSTDRWRLVLRLDGEMERVVRIPDDTNVESITVRLARSRARLANERLERRSG